jgi:dihydrofolate synthase/folylpolyglutamate synthase
MTIMMQPVPLYQETLDYLYSFVDYSLTRAFRNAPEHFDLGRMRDFMAYLGNPERDYPIIHVAGTKGKGSVSAFCAGALQAAGYRVGLYTSPHLQDYTERIQLNRTPIPQAELVALVDEIRPFLDRGTQLTTFEITTALAFLYFSRQAATAAVFEVGLGGRLDATNIITPLLSVITSISYDHTEILGSTLTEIAGEKAGIVKQAVPLVIAPQQEEARQVFLRVAQERNAPLTQVGRDYDYAALSESLIGGQTMLVWSASDQPYLDAYIESAGLQEWEPTRLTIPLLGYHQVENAATAYAALQVARGCGLPVSEEAIRNGFASTHWPGRFELLQRYPPLVIDCAHNRDSALKLRLALDDYFPGLPVVLVFGASEDKDIEGMYSELLPRVRQVVATRSTHPRAADPELLVNLAHRFGRPAKYYDKVEQALAEAIRLAAGEALVLVTGSIFVAAAAREVWYSDYQSLGVQTAG